MYEEALGQAISYLKNADSLIITAGAGIGIDSGLPDFRGREGFWNAYPALGQAKMAFTDIANPEVFQNDPFLAWGFYGHRLDSYRSTEPHLGFQILKKWGESLPNGYFVFTSNVDGQFQKAGFDPDQVLECHGSIHFLQCAAPCSYEVWSASEIKPVVNTKTCRWEGILPICPHCNGLARPNILMFDDWDWIERPSYLEATHFRDWQKGLKTPIVIELGAGKHIPTVRRFSEKLSVPIIRINPYDHEVSTKGIGLPMSALEALKQLDELWKG